LASTADLRPSLRAVLGRDEVAAACQLDGCDAEVYPTSPEEIVQIALTSGTTGAPKLASLSARLKQLTFEGFTARLQMVAGDGVLPLSPISQGVGEMSLYALRLGACLVMAHEPRFDAEQALRLVASSRPTVLSGVPTMISRMLHCPVEADLSALRLTAVAGAPMPPEVAAAWEQRSGAPVCSFYGAMDIGQLAVGSPDDPVEQRWHSVGRPHEAAEVLVCDPDGRPLQAGEVGEVCMRGPLVQDRYWGEEAGPYAADGWAHFGDLGYLDTDGFLHVVGRTKDIVIRGGNNINPFELEAMLSDHPAVAEACLVGVPDPDLGERAVVFVVVRPGQRVSLDELLAFLASRGLARYKWPERLVVLDELPLGASGKVARRALRELAAAAEGAVDARAGGGTDARAGGGTGVPRRGYG
ncbi:MAG TPA: fatty acid--CoA ligase family protein, partial [Acidimicrobiales bacterium]|nr:fatty acid--CoA ligase family protein [Acidimicrobiales bacterium]